MAGFDVLFSLALPEVLLRKTRSLPCDGEVVVKFGDLVHPTDVVARAKRPAQPLVIMAGQALGVSSQNLTRLLCRWAGESIQQDEILAEKKGVLRLGRRICRSPIDGVVISGPHAAGEVVISGLDEKLVLQAGVPGRVVGVLPNRGVVIETSASYVQGVGGYGGEAEGALRMIVDGPDKPIQADAISPDCAGSVLIGGVIGSEALSRASQVGAVGVVVGDISGEGYQWLLANRPMLTVVVTEGDGAELMNPETFQLLQRRTGMRALVNGTPGAEARAEVIVALPTAAKAGGPPQLGFTVGARVRVLRGPCTGQSGCISALPPVPRRLPSGVVASVADLELDDGHTASVACSNVTLIV